jgi:hypothetical protein
VDSCFLVSVVFFAMTGNPFAYVRSCGFRTESLGVDPSLPRRTKYIGG